MEAYLLRKGVSFESIKQMSEREVMEYLDMFHVFDELEAESINEKM